MRFGFAVLVMLLFVGSAEAEDMGKAEGQASFPANGWAYIGMSPDAPGLRSVFILPLREACEYGVDLERKKAKPGLRMTYTNCQRVALGQPTDDAWWLFSIRTTGRTTPVTTWAGSTARAMCENFRRDTFAWRYANQRVGQTCQLMNLKLAVATERTAEPADSITATPPFPAQGWGYVLTAAETPGKRALIH